MSLNFRAAFHTSPPVLARRIGADPVRLGFRRLRRRRRVLRPLFWVFLPLLIACSQTDAGTTVEDEAKAPPAPNSTRGQTAASRQYEAGAEPSSVAVADLSGDDYLDIVVTNQRSGNITVLLGDGTGSFAPSSGSPYPAGDHPADIAIADFDGDEALDLAIANHETAYCTVLLGDGDGNFSPAPGSPVPVQSSPHPHGITAGDLDSDGRIDLIVDNTNEHQLELLLGNGDGSFVTPGPLVNAGRRPYRKAQVGDANGDGDADIMITNWLGDSVTILLGDGSGAFSQAPGSPLAVPRTPFYLAIGDLNGDARLDLGIAQYAGSFSERGADGLSVLLGDGSGGFEPAEGSPFPAGHAPVCTAVGDVNGDGVLDVATANMASNDVTVLLGGSNGFAPARGSPFAVGRAPNCLALGDLNGDGRADIVTADNADGRVTVLLMK